jgi:hypothetical protein
MFSQVDKRKENKSRAVSDFVSQKKRKAKASCEYIKDCRETVGQRKLIQLMSLGQVSKKENAIEKIKSSGDRHLVSDGREVHLYVKNSQETQGTRELALRKAAEINGNLGQQVDNHARNKWNKPSNEKWTETNENLDDSRLDKIDPFFLGIIVPFTNDGMDETLELIFQHAKTWSGYVEAVYDSTNKATSSVPTMYDSNSESATDPSVSEGHYRNKKYSNIHDTKGNEKLLNESKGQDEKNLDAYTKIAGEGARWICVRNASSVLNNQTRFFTINPSNKNKVYCVNFKTLWKTWAHSFDKQYNISDQLVAKKLKKNELKTSSGKCRNIKNLTTMKSGDYNLDTSSIIE